MRILAFVLLLFSIIAHQSCFAFEVKKILVNGNERITTDAVLSYLQFDVGEDINEDNINDALKDLYATGFFKDINIERTDNTIIINLKENPAIRKIEFVGNKKIEEKDLKEALLNQPRTTFSETNLKMEIDSMKELYLRKGLVDVCITYEIKTNDESIDIIYNIDEGKVKYIKKIDFEGNCAFSKYRLRKVIASKEKVFWRLFTSVDTYDADRLEYDSELLRQFYLNKGYYDFNITELKVEKDENSGCYIINFIICEGPVYRICNISIESEVKEVDIPTLNKKLTFCPNDVYSEKQIWKAINNITDYLNDLGYAFVDVEPMITKNSSDNTVDICFKIKRSPKVYVRYINIKNNTRTLDKVIRREMVIDEGDPFNASKVKRSVQKIKNLGFFNNVDIKNVRTEEFDKIDMDLEVEETSTGEIHLGAGYTTGKDEGVSGLFNIREKNFLGRGFETALSFMVGQYNSDASFSFIDPYFLDQRLKAGIKIFANKQNRKDVSNYTFEGKGAIVSATYYPIEYLAHTLSYNVDTEKVTGVPPSASIFMQSQQGERLRSMVGQSFVYNRLDDDFDPTSGYAFILSQNYAGVGGDVYYLQNEGNITKYFSFNDEREDKIILKIVGRAGNIKSLRSKALNISNRIFLGQDDIRGFDTAGIGPRYKGTDESLGGNKYVLTKVELISPPMIAGIQFFAFHDAATLIGLEKNMFKPDIFYSTKWRASYGAGFKVNSGLGPLVIDFGKAYRKENFDKIRVFRLSYSTPF